MTLIHSLLGGRDGPVDSNAPQGRRARDDAYNPKADQQEILGRVRQDAEADAIRHAEDMIERDFPVVEEAGSIGAQRIAALGAAYAAARSRIDAEIDDAQTRLETVEEEIGRVEEELERREVDRERTDLPPLGDRLVSRWQVLAGLAVGAAAGVSIARLDLAPSGIAAVVAVAVLAIGAILALRIGQPETAAVTSLRRTRRRKVEEKTELRAKLAHEERVAKGLVKETLSLVEGEREFAKLMVATYESAASSALPAGSLDNRSDRSIKKQRTPDVRIPPWAEDLEAAE